MQALSKTNKFKADIRQKYLEQYFEAERKRTKNQSSPIHTQRITPQHISQYLSEGSVKSLYLQLSQGEAFQKLVPQQLWKPILQLLITQSSLKLYEGLLLLGLMIVSCCNSCQPGCEDRHYMLGLLRQYRVCELIYQQLSQQINKPDVKLLRLYLHVIKFCAISNVEEVRNPLALQKYLPMLVEHLLKEQNTLIILSYVSESHKLDPCTIATLCQQSLKQEGFGKIVIANILTNYIILEGRTENIEALFHHLMCCLIHFYINCKPQNNKIRPYMLESMIRLVGKYPDNAQIHFMQAIEKSKVQDILMVLLSIAPEDVKARAFEIEQAIIEKGLPGLGEHFFKYFHQEIVDKIVEGLEYSHVDIIGRCLKMLMQICEYGGQAVVKRLSNKESAYILENMAYHTNNYISSSADLLLERFKESLQEESTMQQEVADP